MVIRKVLAGAARAAVEIGTELAAAAANLAVRNRWARAFGRGAAWEEGRDTALCNAALLAHDMGHPDVRQAINALMPDGSPFIPMDDPRHPRNKIHVRMRIDDTDPDHMFSRIGEDVARAMRRNVDRDR